ncbi:Tim44 domain-containing protein [Piscinibacter sakaiensis]|nr:Tim44-like domain-containing protein [Piscinibacter sakaiensis]
MPGLLVLGRQAVSWMGRGGALRRLGRRRPARAAVPAGLDVAHLLAAAREQFLRLQAAWDAGDMDTLGALTTPQMLEDLRAGRAGAEGPVGRTDVLSLQARLLGFDAVDQGWLAAIEFSGLLRESPDAPAPVAFRELWLLLREHPADPTAPAWRLARQQALF